MKTWTMPKVNIEAFTPNEYVAGCAEHLLGNLGSGNKYWDINGNSQYDDEEQFSNYDSRHGFYKVDSSIAPGPQGTVSVYMGYKNSGSFFNPTYHYTNFVDSYYVYVVKDSGGSKYAYFYKDGYNPVDRGYTPTYNKAFS